jgi:DNA polymerase-4
VSVKLREPDFSTITRSRTLGEATDVSRVIYITARELYEASGLERVPLRLIGVRVENLAAAGPQARQLALDEPEHGWREAEQAMDEAARRFGRGAIRPAALIRPPFSPRGDGWDSGGQGDGGAPMRRTADE